MFNGPPTAMANSRIDVHDRRNLSLFSAYRPVVHKVLSLDQLEGLYQSASRTGNFHQNVLDDLRVRVHISPMDLSRLPSTGPLVAVANHPFGLLEGSLLGAILPSVRRDYKIVTNHLLACMPVLEKDCIFVDPFQQRGSAARNARGLKQAIRWLRDGHMLVIFPAGEVSHWSPQNHAGEDPQWSETAVRLIRLTESPAVPLYFKGVNSLPFHLLGLLNARLRTARLPHELFNKGGKEMEVRVGSVIQFQTIAEITNDASATQYLRWRTYLLRERNNQVSCKRAIKQFTQPIAPAGSPDKLINDLAHLHEGQRLDESREFSVYLAKAEQIPHLLLEIGRLREITFRQVGEGTGNARDLDRFDQYYEHLLVWSKVKQELVGGYRLGDVSKIVRRYGVNGLYTSTLFRYKPAFFKSIGPAFELGRSFVRPEYQKKYAPLLSLWKGIGRHVSRHPEKPVLFGAVSISNDYNPASRQVVVQLLQASRQDQRLSRLVSARRPFVTPGNLGQNTCPIREICLDLESLSGVISDLEADGKGIPILLKQYLKLGGTVLGFNLDVQFANVVDGLVLVDLRDTNREVLDRYMGKEAARLFLTHSSQQGSYQGPEHTSLAYPNASTLR